MLLPQNLKYLNDLALYLAIVGSSAVAIIGWSQYNLRRFQGLDRRTAPALLGVTDEAYYHLPLDRCRS